MRLKLATPIRIYVLTLSAIATLIVASVVIAVVVGFARPTGVLNVSGPRPAPPEYELKARNGTTLTVTLVVNGSPLRTVGPRKQIAVPTRDLPPLPWDVQARSPSGRVLLSLPVRAGSVTETITPSGARAYQSPAARVDLSCGRLDVWVGLPLLGPMPGPGRPGDCEP